MEQFTDVKFDKGGDVCCFVRGVPYQMISWRFSEAVSVFVASTTRGRQRAGTGEHLEYLNLQHRQRSIPDLAVSIPCTILAFSLGLRPMRSMRD
jgi:hypothetical protein